MSSGEFYRARIITQFNIPQIQSGKISGFNPVYRTSLQILSVPFPYLTLEAPGNVFSEIDAIPLAPDTLRYVVPMPTISVQATTP